MTQPLFTIGDILAATGGRAEAVSAANIASITIDSRDIGPDALFVAIKGDRFDGHDFVQTALAHGAVAALVSAGRASGPGTIVVSDALEALCDLARAARARSHALIVGVTGSVGKTTTKEMIRAVFADAGQTHASIKSFNNHWGVPLMLARMPQSAQFGVFEMGMNAPDEIRPLSQLVRPHIAVITSVAPVHLEGLGSIEAIAGAKAEIFQGLEPRGTAVLNADHAQLDLLLAAAKAAGVGRIVTYGAAPGADWRITEVESLADRSFATIEHAGEHYALTLEVPGRHMVANATAALAVSCLSGIEPSAALRALAGLGAQPGRGLRSALGPADKPLWLIDESFNANPVAIAAALEVFAAIKAPGGRKVVVLGDMLELGPQGPALHAGLRPAVLAAKADRIFLVGDGMAALAEALGPGRVAAHAQTAGEMADILLNDLAYGDAVMVKASKGMGLADIVEKIRNRFA